MVTYWCRLAALEKGLKLDKKSKESLALLLPLMDWLEKEKKVLKEQEAISSTIVAAAHIENYANKLFLWADKEDRDARYVFVFSENKISTLRAFSEIHTYGLSFEFKPSAEVQQFHFLRTIDLFWLQTMVQVFISNLISSVWRIKGC